MSFKESLKKLEASKEFQIFKKTNKDAFLFSGFFILNTENKVVEAQQFNFYIPSEERATTFFINHEIKHKTEPFKSKGKITELNADIKIDLKEVQDIIKKELEKQKPKLKVGKIIAVLQKAFIRPEIKEEQTEQAKEQEEVQIWNMTCLCGFKLFRMQINSISGKILKKEEVNLSDFIRVKK